MFECIKPPVNQPVSCVYTLDFELTTVKLQHYRHTAIHNSVRIRSGLLLLIVFIALMRFLKVFK